MDHAAATWASLQAIRARAPLIHNITNFVAMDASANCLLALGASPAMVHAEEEVAEFVGLAQALVVNIGTLSPAWVAAMHRAVEAAAARGVPWVLDPVGAGATAYRRRTALELAERRPAVIRGNASEILTLAGAAGRPSKGVDSTHAVDEARDAADELARRMGCVVAVTGAVDYVSDGTRSLRIANGDPRMTKVTALGCAASATVGAFLTVEADPVSASAQALALFGLAGERAAAQARGPGTLRVALLDELATLTEAAVREGVRIS